MTPALCPGQNGMELAHRLSSCPAGTPSCTSTSDAARSLCGESPLFLGQPPSQLTTSTKAGLGRASSCGRHMRKRKLLRHSFAVRAANPGSAADTSAPKHTPIPSDARSPRQDWRDSRLCVLRNSDACEYPGTNSHEGSFHEGAAIRVEAFSATAAKLHPRPLYLPVPETVATTLEAVAGDLDNIQPRWQQRGHLRWPELRRGHEVASEAQQDALRHGVEGEVERATLARGDRSGAWTSEEASRQRLELTLALAFVICNMDKVNLSVAIIQMSQDLGWSVSTQGLVHASFFWGYSLTQLPGGWLASRVGGEAMLRGGVLLWSLASMAAPMAAYTSVPAMFASRFLVGLGEGVAPAAATDVIARNVPKEERSRAVSLVFGGFSVGSVVGLVLSPLMVEHLGWESVFFTFGALGLAWCAAYGVLRGPWPSPTTSHQPSAEGAEHQSVRKEKKRVKWERVPWRALLRSTSVRALIATHFCHDWGKYCLQAWLPTYYTSHLHLSLAHASMAALAAPLGSVAVAAAAGTVADRLVAEGMSVTHVRRMCQVTAFLAPALAMGSLCLMENASPFATVALLTGGLAMSSIALAGLYCAHQDISPKYSPVLLGLSNTAGALPGFVGVALTGYLYDQTHSWDVSLFLPSVGVLLLGAAIWLKWVDNSPVDFDEQERQLAGKQ